MSDTDYLATPLFEKFHAVGNGNFNTPHYFEISSLFWSLSRLFGFYHRIVSVYDPDGVGPNHQDTNFLDADLEGFIIRFRIILNDIAFVFRQLYPAKIQGLPQLGRGRSDRNREMSFRDLHKFLKRNPRHHPSLLAAIENNRSWLYTLMRQREDILHYKATVVIFECTGGDHNFAILKASGDEPCTSTPEGGKRVILTPVFQFVNQQTSNLIQFMNRDLVNALDIYARDHGFVDRPFGIRGSSRMTGIGIRLFRQINRI